MTDEETSLLRVLLHNNPGLEVTPSILLSFVAEKTKHTPPRSPLTDQDVELPGGRGRGSDREEDAQQRSTSNDSRASSRGPPQTPTSSKSPFDNERRQRSTPLNAPSSWSKRPAPASRRKSDAGSRSDSEVSILNLKAIIICSHPPSRIPTAPVHSGRRQDEPARRQIPLLPQKATYSLPLRVPIPEHAHSRSLTLSITGMTMATRPQRTTTRLAQRFHTTTVET